MAAFWILCGWGLYEAEIWWDTALAYAVVWLLLALGFFLAPKLMIPCAVGLTAEAAVMTLVVLGKDIDVPRWNR